MPGGSVSDSRTEPAPTSPVIEAWRAYVAHVRPKDAPECYRCVYAWRNDQRCQTGRALYATYKEEKLGGAKPPQ